MLILGFIYPYDVCVTKVKRKSFTDKEEDVRRVTTSGEFIDSYSCTKLFLLVRNTLVSTTINCV